MKYYTETISVPLAEKLKEKGMPYIDIDCNTFDEGTQYQRDEVWCNNTYAEVFDWLMERGWLVDIGREYDFATEQVTKRFEWAIEKVECFSSQPDNGGGWRDTWHEAATEAIEKTLELIK